MIWLKAILARKVLGVLFDKIISKIFAKKIKEEKTQEPKTLEQGLLRCGFCLKVYEAYWDGCPHCGLKGKIKQ